MAGRTVESVWVRWAGVSRIADLSVALTAGSVICMRRPKEPNRTSGQDRRAVRTEETRVLTAEPKVADRH